MQADDRSGWVKEKLDHLRENIGRVIVGKPEALDMVMAAMICRGHVLVEDVPGVGKTMLIKALARSLDCSFKRIQFTPDLLPSDVTGVSLYDQKKQDFVFRPGPVMANLVLADEINRATPRTQSSLLECMEERQVTVDGVTYHLEEPFLVMATQNPIELEGTFPLPEAQLDRFFLKMSVGYPDAESEIEIVLKFGKEDPLYSLGPVLDRGEVLQIQQYRKGIHVSAEVLRYLVELVRATRENTALGLGASPRGSLALFQAAQARALIKGRGYVVPDDVKAMTCPVLGHRLVLTEETRLRGMQASEILEGILDKVMVPVEGLEDGRS